MGVSSLMFVLTLLFALLDYSQGFYAQTRIYLRQQCRSRQNIDLMVVRMADGAKPQPPQKMSAERFLEWVAKQKSQANKCSPRGYRTHRRKNVDPEGTGKHARGKNSVRSEPSD